MKNQRYMAIKQKISDLQTRHNASIAVEQNLVNRFSPGWGLNACVTREGEGIPKNTKSSENSTSDHLEFVHKYFDPAGITTGDIGVETEEIEKKQFFLLL